MKKLAPQVKPKDDEDTQVKDGPKQVYHIAANCMARAGDCAAAKKVFDDAYPNEILATVKDPATKTKIKGDNFNSLVGKCKGSY